MDVAPALSEDNLFTAARRVLRNIRADEAGGGLTSRDTIIAAELLSRHIDREEKRIKEEWERQNENV